MGHFSWSISVLAGVAIAAWIAMLCWWDVKFRRLPDSLTVPPAVGLLIAGVLIQPMALWGLVWPATYLFTAANGGGLGGGDIKLAVPLGIACAWCNGVVAVFVAMCAASLITAAILSAARIRDCPHGPSMFCGVLISVLSCVVA